VIDEVFHSPGGKISSEKIRGWRSSVRQAFCMRMGARALTGGPYQEMKLIALLPGIKPAQGKRLSHTGT